MAATATPITVTAMVAQPAGVVNRKLLRATIDFLIDLVKTSKETVAVALAVDIPRVDIICSA